MPPVNNVTKSTRQINKTQNFPSLSIILCVGLLFPFFPSIVKRGKEEPLKNLG